MLSSFEKAIKLAIEEGNYKSEKGCYGYIQEDYNDCGWYEDDGYFHHCPISSILIDPEFWQALGRALGKNKSGLNGDEWEYGNSDYRPWWLATATDFFELTLTKGDIEAFWNQQLKN